MEMALLSGSENGITQKRFAPEFWPGRTIAQTQGAVMSIAAIETYEDRRTAVVGQHSQPFRSQLITIGDNPLISLMHTAHEFEGTIGQGRITIDPEHRDITGAPGLIPVSEHAQRTATVDNAQNERH
jgi:hypothetical protein